jgi:polygalacturonase
MFLFVCAGGCLSALAQTVPLPIIPSRTFTITDSPYNAVGDGITTNTAAIQKAITDCTTAGGGTIVVPAGIFLCGPITLGKSDNLQLASGALLRMLPFGSFPTNVSSFITASSVNDVEISGSGGIDGQGPPWLAAFANNANLVRPEMFTASKCTRIAVLGVFFTNAPVGHLSTKANTSETIQGITIFTSFPSKNTDGVDLAAVGAYVAGNSISDGDDVIALGSSASFTANVFVTNCAFGNGHGLSMGSDTGGGVSNIVVVNCTFTGTQYGLKGKSARDRGGVAQNVNYLNLTLTNIQFPISYSSYYPQNPTDPSLDTGSPITSTTPFWRNITLSNVTASAANFFSVGSVWGLPEAPVSNLVMKAVSLTGQNGLQLYHVRAVSFASDCSINVSSSGRLFTYDAQVSSQLQLSNAVNRAGITSDGAAFTGGGANGNGSAYSATTLGASLSPGGYLFTFGAANATNAVSATGQTLPVPTGLQATNYQALTFLGASVNGAQSNQTFVIHYSDSSTQTFQQNFSDWGTAQHYPGETIVSTMNHRNLANGTSQGISTLLYQYSFPLSANKTATGLTLPNNTNLIVLGALVTISPSNTAPLLAPISSRTITAGSTLSLTATAADTDQPPQRLTFSLPIAPVGASVDPATGMLTWRPGIAQAGVNPFTLVVTDSGSPNLSATQTFNVTVNLPAPPSIQPASFTNGQFSFSINGASGPDYLVQASTNLTNWITIATNNAPTPPFLWSDPDTNLFTRRFYRVLLGP